MSKAWIIIIHGFDMSFPNVYQMHKLRQFKS